MGTIALFFPFPHELDSGQAWEFRLKYAQGLVDEWISCQRTWLYLEPIFSSEDIMRQLPTEARRFNSVDQLWKKVRYRRNYETKIRSSSLRGERAVTRAKTRWSFGDFLQNWAIRARQVSQNTTTNASILGRGWPCLMTSAFEENWVAACME